MLIKEVLMREVEVKKTSVDKSRFVDLDLSVGDVVTSVNEMLREVQKEYKLVHVISIEEVAADQKTLFGWQTLRVWMLVEPLE